VQALVLTGGAGFGALWTKLWTALGTTLELVTIRAQTAELPPGAGFARVRRMLGTR
jgi:hypothetical protein